MSYILIQQLVSIRNELEVAKATVDYLERLWPRLHMEPDFIGLQVSQVRRTAANLEATYIVRLFSTFESILRDCLLYRYPNRPNRRSAYDLINRAASKWRISADYRDEAHRIREFRNRAVHQNEAASLSLPFADALAGLNRFLSWLPDVP